MLLHLRVNDRKESPMRYDDTLEMVLLAHSVCSDRATALLQHGQDEADRNGHYMFSAAHVILAALADLDTYADIIVLLSTFHPDLTYQRLLSNINSAMGAFEKAPAVRLYDPSAIRLHKLILSERMKHARALSAFDVVVLAFESGSTAVQNSMDSSLSSQTYWREPLLELVAA